MIVFLWVVVGVLGVLVFSFSVYAFAEGGLGILEGARFERCPRCGRHGLAVSGRLHEEGCPHASYRQRFRHRWGAWWSALHLSQH